MWLCRGRAVAVLCRRRGCGRGLELVVGSLVYTKEDVPAHLYFADIGQE